MYAEVIFLQTFGPYRQSFLCFRVLTVRRKFSIIFQVVFTQCDWYFLIAMKLPWNFCMRRRGSLSKDDEEGLEKRDKPTKRRWKKMLSKIGIRKSKKGIFIPFFTFITYFSHLGAFVPVFRLVDILYSINSTKNSLFFINLNLTQISSSINSNVGQISIVLNSMQRLQSTELCIQNQPIITIYLPTKYFVTFYSIRAQIPTHYIQLSTVLFTKLAVPSSFAELSILVEVNVNINLTLVMCCHCIIK